MNTLSILVVCILVPLILHRLIGFRKVQVIIGFVSLSVLILLSSCLPEDKTVLLPHNSNMYIVSVEQINKSTFKDASRRARYNALFYLVSQRARMKGKGSDEYELFEKLKTLDVHDSEDSLEVEKIGRIVLKDLDTDITTPENEFLDTELFKRAEWAVYNSVWHSSYKDNVFDELGRDVLRMGIPEKEKVEISKERILVVFPNAGNYERHYEYKLTSGYTSIPTDDVRDEILIGYRGKLSRNVPATLMADAISIMIRKELQKRNYKIYAKTKYDELEGIIIRPFTYPCHDINDNKYNLTAAGIDVFGKLKNVVESESGDNHVIRLVVRYVISDAQTNEIIDFDSISYEKEITEIDREDNAFCVSLYTKPFHDRTIRRPNSVKSDYLLGVSVSHGGKKYEQSYHFSLSDDNVSIPEYNLMLVRDYPARRDENISLPYWCIPFFKPEDIVKRSEMLDIWLPVTNLSYNKKFGSYCGIIEVYLVEEQTMRGLVKEGGYQTLWNNTDFRIQDNSDGESGGNILKPIAVDTIYSRQANLLDYRLRFPVPRKAPKWDSSLIVFIKSLPDSGGKSKLLAGAIRDIYIK